MDARAVLQKGLERFGGRGGGKPAMAQGGFQDVSSAERALEAMVGTAGDLLRYPIVRGRGYISAQS